MEQVDEGRGTDKITTSPRPIRSVSPALNDSSDLASKSDGLWLRSDGKSVTPPIIRSCTCPVIHVITPSQSNNTDSTSTPVTVTTTPSIDSPQLTHRRECSQGENDGSIVGGSCPGSNSSSVEHLVPTATSPAAADHYLISGHVTPDSTQGGLTPSQQGLSDSQQGFSGSQQGFSGSQQGLSGTEGKQKKKNWYNVLAPNYKSRHEDFKRLFPHLPEGERLLLDYSCAIQKDILVHGRLYASQNWLCFYANIFRWETILTVPMKEITSMTKERTAKVFPNAIQVTWKEEKHFLTSFTQRDKAFFLLFKIWQNALLDQPMSLQQLWSWVHHSYGEELGLTSDDDDYVLPIPTPPLPATTVRAGLAKLNSNLRDLAAADGEGRDISVNDENMDGLLDNSYDGDMDAGDVLIMRDGVDHCRRRHHHRYMVNGDDGVMASSRTHTVNENEMYQTNRISSESEADQHITCGCPSHDGRLTLDKVYNITVDQMFTFLFTDNHFFRTLCHNEKTTGLNLPDWTEKPTPTATGDKSSGKGDNNDKENNNENNTIAEEEQQQPKRYRQITYTVTVNSTLAKSAATTETQICANSSIPSRRYTVRCEVVNSGIPYADNFAIVNLYCLSKVSKLQCRLQVHSLIHYRKQVWGFVKNFIERNVNQGVHDHFNALDKQLDSESASLLSKLHVSKSRKRRTIRLRHHHQPVAVSGGAGSPASAGVDQVIGGDNVTPGFTGYRVSSIWPDHDSILSFIFILLMCLVFVNALLFYKLHQLETMTNSKPSPSLLHLHHEFNDYISSGHHSEEEWSHILLQQQSLYKEEIGRWREILDLTFTMVEQMQASLSQLRDSIKVSENRYLRPITTPSSSPEDS